MVLLDKNSGFMRWHLCLGIVKLLATAIEHGKNSFLFAGFSILELTEISAR